MSNPNRQHRTLTEELEHLERTNPEVAAAAANYDRTVWRMNLRARMKHAVEDER